MKRRCVVACNDQLVATHLFMTIQGAVFGFALALLLIKMGWVAWS